MPSEIGNLSNLRYLSLRNNKITTLPNEIINLTNLKKLDLRENNFSEAEKEKISKMLPNCKIEF